MILLNLDFKIKSIKTKGLNFGSDIKFGDNMFLGLAVRYEDSKSNIHDSIQNTELESLTLNLYGIAPINENRYINAVLGLSALRFDSKYLGNLSGSRNGKQVFTSINYRTKNTFSGFNLTPTGKFTYGVTRLSEFTDFFSKAIDGSTKDVRYAEDTFKSGEFAAGFLFSLKSILTSVSPSPGIRLLTYSETLLEISPELEAVVKIKNINKNNLFINLKLLHSR